MERTYWRETWRANQQWMDALEQGLRQEGVPTRRGGDFDGWDFEVRCGTLGSARTLLAIEEHGAGKQMGRWRLWPRPSAFAIAMAAVAAALALGAAIDHAWLAAIVLGAVAAALTARIASDCGVALGALDRALQRHGSAE